MSYHQEYLVCLKRGHSLPPTKEWQKCRWCGTDYRYKYVGVDKTELVERGVPGVPTYE